MTIDAHVESCYPRQRRGEDYWLVTAQGRKFVTVDAQLGEKMLDSVGLFGRFTYKFPPTPAPNIYELTAWEKL